MASQRQQQFSKGRTTTWCRKASFAGIAQDGSVRDSDELGSGASAGIADRELRAQALGRVSEELQQETESTQCSFTLKGRPAAEGADT